MHLMMSARRGISGLLESASVLCLAAGGSVLCAAPAQGGTAADLDIKPGSCPNPLNRVSRGFLPVALVGTAGFDVTQVDLSSLVLVRKDDVGGAVSPNEGPPGPHSVFKDAATPFTGKNQCDCAELRGDGILDLLLKFRTRDLIIALELNDVPAGALVSLVLTGELLDGTPFEADDCVLIVPPVLTEGRFRGAVAGPNPPGRPEGWTPTAMSSPRWAATKVASLPSASARTERESSRDRMTRRCACGMHRPAINSPCCAATMESSWRSASALTGLESCPVRRTARRGCGMLRPAGNSWSCAATGAWSVRRCSLPTGSGS